MSDSGGRSRAGQKYLFGESAQLPLRQIISEGEEQSRVRQCLWTSSSYHRAQEDIWHTVCVCLNSPGQEMHLIYAVTLELVHGSNVCC